MGVTGLWQLLSPVGTRVPLETLENKILAIDISIWLNQAVKGFRDSQGGAQANAHLLGLFHRVCKLLFYKIKPVFVFDGSAPLLKKQTIESRRKHRQVAINSAEKTAQQILTNLMARELVGEASSSSNAKKKSNSPQKKFKSGGSTKANPIDDIFWLPPLSENLSKTESTIPLSDDDDDDEIPMVLDSIFERDYQNLNEVDIESAEFNALPPNIKHEILSEMKERKREQFYRQHEMPRESGAFSDYQMSRLLKRRQLTKKLDEVKNELNSHTAGKLMSNLEGELAAMQKIASEDNTHTILIRTSNIDKRSKLTNKESHQPGFSQEKETCTSNEIEVLDDTASWTNPDSPTNDGEMNMVENEMTLRQIIKDSVVTDKKKISSHDSEILTVQSLSPKSIKKNFGEKCIPQTEEPNFFKAGESSTKSRATDKAKSQSVEDYTINDVDSPIPLEIQNIQAIEDQFIIYDSSDSDLECFAYKKDSETPKKDSETPKKDSETPKKNSETPKKDSEKLKKDSETLKKDSEKLKNDSVSPLKSLTVRLDISRPPPKDDDLFPSEIFDVINKDMSKGNTTDINIMARDKVLEIESGINDDLFSNISMAVDDKITHYDLTEIENATMPEKEMENEDLQSAMGGEGPNNEIIQPKETRPKSHIIEDFLQSKLPRESESTTGLALAHNEKTETVSVLVDMTEENLSDLKNKLDLERLEFIRDQKKMERQAQTLSDQIILESQELLKLFGVPFIVSPTEAEAQCAQLELLGLTDGTITDDSDIWLFGGSKVFKNFFTQGKFLECYTIHDIEIQFGLDRSQLICFALMTGSDYTEGIEGVGPVRAMEVISEFKKDGFETLKAFREWWDVCRKSSRAPGNKVRSKLLKLELPETFPHYRIYEAYIKPEVDTSNEKFSWGLPNLDELRQLSKEKFGWTRDKVDEILLPVMKKVSERTSQMRIDSYYSVTISQKEKNLFPSKRIQSALTKIKPSKNISDGASSSTRKNDSKRCKTDKRGKKGTKNLASKSSIKKVIKVINLSEDSSSDDCMKV